MLLAAPTAAPSWERVQRQLTIPGFGAAQQERLHRATALVAGVGGIGGAAATYLAAAGIGRLVLVHPGMLEAPDLNRQTLMRPDRVGSSRVACAAETLREHYPDVQVTTRPWEVTHPDLPELVASADVVIDARHNFPERYHLNRTCVLQAVPLVVAAMNATEGFLLSVERGAPCLRCVFPEGDPAWQPLAFPVLGAVAGTVGCLAAMEAMKLVAGFGRPVTERLLHIDLWDMNFQTLGTHPDPGCPDCGSTQPATLERRVTVPSRRKETGR